MFYLNDKQFFGFTISFYVLIGAVFYLVFLVIYRPYRLSLFIHDFTIILNHFMYILSLIIMNAANFNLKPPETYLLIFSYLMMGLSFAVIVLAVVRVFLDYKYGF